MSHFNPNWTKQGSTPCGKDLRRCNWATYLGGVTCKTCLKIMATELTS